MDQTKLNLLITLDSHYLYQAKVMLSSLLYTNPNCSVSLYILHNSLTRSDIADLKTVLDPARCTVFPIVVNDPMLEHAPVTRRYPVEMYYRIFAARYLPEELDRILYLDPDIVVRKSIVPLYTLPLGNCYFAAASHVKTPIRKLNELRLGGISMDIYINSGVLLIHLDLLRKEQKDEEVFAYIQKHKNTLLLPDQDIISGLYGSRILALEPYRYNMSEKMFFMRPEAEAFMNLDWVREHSAIIHYCGKNKPWKEKYIGSLGIFYYEAEQRMKQEIKRGGFGKEANEHE